MKSLFDNGCEPNNNNGRTPACDFDEIDDMQTALEELLAKPERDFSDETENRNSNM